MTELEGKLEALATELEWPATPQFTLGRRRRVFVVGVAAALLAIGTAFAVPQARSAILRLFDIGGVSVERVDTLPAAQERSLAASLGVPVGAGAARELLGTPFRTPDSVASRLYRSGAVVSTLLATPAPVLLSEFRAGVRGDVLVKKLAGGSTDVRGVDLGFAAPAVWIRGREHVYLAPPLPPRLAGNTLIWVRGGITFRLEGRTLSLARARMLAREVPR